MTQNWLSLPKQRDVQDTWMEKQFPRSWKRCPSLWHKDGKHSPKKKDLELIFLIDSYPDQGKETSYVFVNKENKTKEITSSATGLISI